jgi:hypothetical protein
VRLLLSALVLDALLAEDAAEESSLGEGLRLFASMFAVVMDDR